MIHRDIKPANILLTRRGQAVITDFGIAQIVGATQHTAAGALMGTLNYIAPEQGLEGRSDVRSDIYSLGIVFYEMLTRRTPFDADTPLAVLMKHLRDPLPLPRQINPAIPEPFERIVFKALAKQPGDRYQSAGEMARALRAAADEAGVELPDRISLPLSFTTAEAPSESVVVFSGTAREKIADAQFADDDTDATLGQRLEAERAALEGEAPTTGGAGQQLLSAIGTLGGVVAAKMTEAVRDAIEAAASGPPEKVPVEATSSEAPATEMPATQLAAQSTDARQQPAAIASKTESARDRRGLVKPVLGAIWLVIIANLLAVWLAGLTGWWDIFEVGWPIELFLVSLGLCIVMAAAENIWLLLPAGILLGNGVLFSYCTVTGNWRHWLFLWPLELLIIIGTVLLTTWLSGRGGYSRRMARALAWILGMMSVVWIVIVGLASLVAAIFVPG
jgi:hypothetical protein